MKIQVQAETVDIDITPTLKDSFFSMLANTNMNKDLDLEAYFMYKLTTLKVNELKDLCDKYCVPCSTFCALSTDLSLDRDFKTKHIQTLIKHKANDTIGHIIAQDQWYTYFDILQPHLLSSEMDVNHVDKYGQTALMYACNNKLTEAALQLIATGKCNYNHQDNYGDTALRSSCIQRLTKVALALIAINEYDYNLQDNNGRTVLMHACGSKLTEVALALISADYDHNYNLRDDEGNTVLMYACQNRLEEVALAIIAEDNIYFNNKNRSGETALSYACSNGLPRVALAIIATNKYNLQGEHGKTALKIACKYELMDVVMAICLHDRNHHQRWKKTTGRSKRLRLRWQKSHNHVFM